MKYGQEWIMRLTLDNETMTANVERVGEIIRCKDCKHCRTYYHGENMPFSYACDHLYLTYNLSDNDYCSRAVRKENRS